MDFTNDDLGFPSAEELREIVPSQEEIYNRTLSGIMSTIGSNCTNNAKAGKFNYTIQLFNTSFKTEELRTRIISDITSRTENLGYTVAKEIKTENENPQNNCVFLTIDWSTEREVTY